MKEEHKRLIESKGGRILEHRTSCQGLSIGDTFKFQCLPEMTVVCFYKSKVFDYYPFVFAANSRGNKLLISICCLVKVKPHEDKIKRTRRI